MKPTKAQALRHAEVLQAQGDYFKGSPYADACIASAKMWREFARAEPVCWDYCGRLSYDFELPLSDEARQLGRALIESPLKDE